jgi:KDO2-lipid IV(A) lauroyltransferase
MNDTPRSTYARAGETWTTRQRVKNDVIYATARMTLFLAQRSPAWALRGLGCVAAWVARFLPSLRRQALANLGRAFPAAGDAERRRLWAENTRTLGRHLVDALLQTAGRAPIYYEVVLPADALDCLRNAGAPGRGVLFVSAHLGPWEQVARALAAADLDFMTVAREPYDTRFRRVYDALRTRHGVRMLYRGDAYAGIKMMRALGRGALLGMPSDLATRGPSIPARLFGHGVLAPVGVARLALRAGSAVVVGTVDGRAAPRYDDRGRRVLPVTVTRVSDLPEDATPAAEANLTQALLDALEARICGYPEGWLWMHPRFAQGSLPEIPPKQGT